MKWPIYIALTAVLFVALTTHGLPFVALNINREGDDGEIDNGEIEIVRNATVESITRAINEETADPPSAPRLARLHTRRGSLWLQQHEPQEAIADFDAALEKNPGEIGARLGRAECFRQLGDPARADAEMRAAGMLEIDAGELFPILNFVSWSAGYAQSGEWMSSSRAWLFVGLALLLLAAANIAVGCAPLFEASGSVLRLVRVAAYLAILQVLPLAVWGGFMTCEVAGNVHGILAAGITVFSFICTIPYLQPPVRLRGTKEKLPRVDEPEFLNRVAELSRKMNVPVPLVRIWPSMTGSQQALAYAGTLQAPQLVVTDGILRRLSPIERDAVVAHELGHIANGSLWYLAAVIPLSCAAATAAAAFLPLTVVVPFGLALAVGLRRLISRPLELDCDLRAARAIGFGETVRALAKIHAVHSLGDAGFLPLVVYATSTHPSRAIRLGALKSAAPPGQLLELPMCQQTIRRHRTASFVAFALWLLALAGTMTAAAWTPASVCLAAPLWIVGLAPLTVQALARWKQIRQMRRRMGQNAAKSWIIAGAALASLALMAFPGALMTIGEFAGWHDDSSLILLTPLLLAVLGFPALFGVKHHQETRKLRAAVAVAFQVHDFRRVIELAASSPRDFARDHILRYNVALARAIVGDRAAAITEFEQLFCDRPGFALGGLSLCLLLLDADHPSRALDVARAVIDRLPRDAGAHLLEARALKRLGRLEEAQGTCERALTLEPGDGMCHAVAAAIALESGDFSRAQWLIDTALELAPGDAYALLVRAEIILQTEPFEDPRPAIEEALSAIRGNPLVFLTADIARLESLCAEAYPETAKGPAVAATC